MGRDDHISLAVFDWAGTIADFGCLAPVAAFVKAFADEGIAVSNEVARGPMGLDKKNHLRALLGEPQTSDAWTARTGRAWNEQDVDRLFGKYVRCQMDALAEHAALVPETLACVENLRRKNIQIGTTTGYFRDAAQFMARAGKEQGFHSACDVCAEDVPVGRPAPFMLYRVMEHLQVYPASHVMKVGDTVPDIEEGLMAGAWSIAVTDSSSQMGLGQKEWAALDEPTRADRRAAVRGKFTAAGAHYVVDSIAELPRILDSIDERLANGECP